MPRPKPQPSPSESSRRFDRARLILVVVWAAIGVVVLLVMAGSVLGSILPALAIIALSVLIILILKAPVAWLERKGLARWGGTLISYLGLFVIVAILTGVFIPLIWEQMIALLGQIPGYISQADLLWQDTYSQYEYLLDNTMIQQIVNSATDELLSFVINLVAITTSSFVDFSTGLVTGAVCLFVSLILSFWVLKDLPSIGREIRVVIGPRFEEDLVFIASTFSRSVTGYLRGVLIQGTCVGILTGCCFALIDMPYPMVLGLLAGLMNFLPFVGPWISAFICGLIGLSIAPLAGLLAILIVIISQQLVDNFITPRVMASVVDLHPAIVLVGIFTGGILGGIVGLIAAVPLLATAKAVFVYYFERKTGRVLVSEHGALFRTSRRRRGQRGQIEDDPSAVAKEELLDELSEKDSEQ